MSKKTSNKPIHIRLIDWQSFWLTLGLILVLAVAMVFMHMYGWDEGLIGGIVSIAVALVFCTLIFDVGLLLTACITVDEGMVNAGKDKEGQVMLFHADKVERIEVRDHIGNVLPEGKKRYRKVCLTFVMESGRTNQRAVNLLTDKQLRKIKDAIVG